MNILEDTFVEDGVYSLKIDKNEENVFLVETLGNNSVGKLVKYKKVVKGLYQRTRTQYFLNDYVKGDIKELFVDRTKYNILGIIGQNFIKKDDFIANGSNLLKNLQ